MKNLLSFEEFIEQLNESINSTESKIYKSRNQKLVGIEPELQEDSYCVQLTIGDDSGDSLITEHEKYQRFKKTTNRYNYHPENPDIPVKGHYHIYPSNGKQEIYSVNMDGTAHHKKNRGYEVPNKEAKELRKLGVDIPKDRIIENRQLEFKFSNTYSMLMLIE